MALKIKYYVTATGHSDVWRVYSESSALRASFDVHLEYLMVRPRQEWRRPRAAKLSRDVDYRDFFEVRFFAERVEQRPIGYFGPAADEFTIVLWATEKGNQLLPKDWNKISNKRRLQIKNNEAFTKPFYEEDEDEAK